MNWKGRQVTAPKKQHVQAAGTRNRAAPYLLFTFAQGHGWLKPLQLAGSQSAQHEAGKAREYKVHLVHERE